MMAKFFIKVNGRDFCTVTVNDEDFVYTVSGPGQQEIENYLNEQHSFMVGGTNLEDGEETLKGHASDNPSFLQRLLIRSKSEFSKLGRIDVEGPWDIFTENIKEKEIKKSLKDLNDLI